MALGISSFHLVIAYKYLCGQCHSRKFYYPTDNQRFFYLSFWQQAGNAMYILVTSRFYQLLNVPNDVDIAFCDSCHAG